MTAVLYNSAVDLATLGALCALGSAMSWAVTSLMVRSLTPRFGALTINAARTTVAAALAITWLLVAGGIGDLAGLSLTGFVLLAVSIVLAITIGDTVFFQATERLGLGRAMTIAMSYPVVAAALAATLLGEPLTIPVAGGGLLTLAGLTLIVVTRTGAPGEPRPWRGVAGAVLAAVAWGVSAVAIRLPLNEVDPVAAQAVRLPVAAALMWATPWARRGLGALARADRRTYASFAALSVLTAASSVMYVAALKYAGVAIGTVLSSTAPLFAVPLGIVFLGERLPPLALVGAVVAVTGIVVLRL